MPDSLYIMQHQQAFYLIKFIPVYTGNIVTLGNGFVDIFQLKQAECGLYFVHLGINPRRNNRDLILESEILEIIDPFFCFLIGRNDRSTLKRIEYLGGMKTEYRKIAEVGDAVAMNIHPEGMTGIIDHMESVGIGDCLDCLEITGVSVDVDRKDRRGFGGYCGFDLLRVEIEAVGFDVAKNRGNPVPVQGMGCCHKTERGGNNLTGTSQALQCRNKRQGPVGKKGNVFDAEVVG